MLNKVLDIINLESLCDISVEVDSMKVAVRRKNERNTRNHQDMDID